MYVSSCNSGTHQQVNQKLATNNLTSTNLISRKSMYNSNEKRELLIDENVITNRNLVSNSDTKNNNDKLENNHSNLLKMNMIDELRKRYANKFDRSDDEDSGSSFESSSDSEKQNSIKNTNNNSQNKFK